MKIYFSCSITGGRADQLIYQAIVAFLEQDGHQVLTAHLASPEVMQEEAVIEPRTVYERDVAWVNECDCLIAEVSTPSHGVGYEIALGLMLGKPVLCCYRTGRRVSKMITGNTHSNLRLGVYDDLQGAVDQVRLFVSTCFSVQ